MRYHCFVYFILFYFIHTSKRGIEWEEKKNERHGTDTVELATNRWREEKKKRGELRTFPLFFKLLHYIFFLLLFFLWCDTNLINNLETIYFFFSPWTNLIWFRSQWIFNEYIDRDRETEKQRKRKRKKFPFHIFHSPGD